MSKYTPAPWATLLHSCAPDKIFSIGPIEAYFEMVDGEVLPFLDVPEEDTRLIAAAPDLLAALKEMVSIVQIHQRATGNNFAWAELPCAIEAIAEAEGRNE